MTPRVTIPNVQPLGGYYFVALCRLGVAPRDCELISWGAKTFGLKWTTPELYVEQGWENVEDLKHTRDLSKNFMNIEINYYNGDINTSKDSTRSHDRRSILYTTDQEMGEEEEEKGLSNEEKGEKRKRDTNERKEKEKNKKDKNGRKDVVDAREEEKDGKKRNKRKRRVTVRSGYGLTLPAKRRLDLIEKEKTGPIIGMAVIYKVLWTKPVKNRIMIIKKNWKILRKYGKYLRRLFVLVYILYGDSNRYLTCYKLDYTSLIL